VCGAIEGGACSSSIGPVDEDGLGQSHCIRRSDELRPQIKDEMHVANVLNHPRKG
jgi:hypothetical protein